MLKKKFNKLIKTKMGTRDPTKPADVCEAKENQRLIVEKSEGVTGSEDEPFATDNGEGYSIEKRKSQSCCRRSSW